MSFLLLFSTSDTVMGVSVDPNPRKYFFLPVNEDWQRRVAGLFGRVKPKLNLYGEADTAIEMQHRCPPRDGLKNVYGDGACLPRVMSLVIYGEQKHHDRLRQAVVDFLLKGPLPGDSSPRDASFYERMTEMRKKKTWMTTQEIRGFAYLLDTPIFTCVHSKNREGRETYFWQRVPHESLQENVRNTRGIYILNKQSHFQLITKP